MQVPGATRSDVVTDIDLITLARRLAAHTNRCISTISRLATSSGVTIPRLEQGSTITVRRCTRAGQWFSDNWPADLAWPAEIVRPAPTDTKRRTGATAVASR